MSAVPAGAFDARARFISSTTSAREKRIDFVFPSRNAWISKWSDSAFTALIPTPFRPTDFWNASESYFAPVLIFAAQSISLPNGIPRP